MDSGNSHLNDSRVEQDRVVSPEPSCESIKSYWSMDHPHNFKDVPYPHSTCLQSGSAMCRSPAHSYVSMKSDWSMSLPYNFKEDVSFPDDSWVQKESSDCPFPSSLSMKSDKSMNPPMSFKRQTRSPELSEFSSSLLTSDHVRCFVCFRLLRDPVSIPCGHNYCKLCINTFWSQPGPTGDYVCLQCEKSYPVRPELSVNVAFNWMLQAHQQMGFSPACPTLPQAASGDVACDVCSSLTRPAIKSCVTCNVSYCENHLRDHYNVPAMQKHTMVQVNQDRRLWNSGRMEEIREELTACKRKRMAVEKDEMFQQASPPAMDVDGCSANRRRRMVPNDLTNTHTPDTLKPTTCAQIPTHMLPPALPLGPLSANAFINPYMLSRSQPFPGIHTHSLDSTTGQLSPTAEYWDTPVFPFDQPEAIYNTEGSPVGISGSDPPTCPSPFQDFQHQ